MGNGGVEFTILNRIFISPILGVSQRSLNVTEEGKWQYSYINESLSEVISKNMLSTRRNLQL